MDDEAKINEVLAEHNESQKRDEAWLKRTREGGTAFPAHGCTPGMTLRDYFAAHALGAILTGLLSSGTGAGAEFPGEANAARWAYEYADAMLKARDK